MRSHAVTSRPPPRDLTAILAPVQAGQARVEAVLDRCVAESEIPLLQTVLASALGGPGKRVRPAIALLIGQAYGVQEADVVLLAAGTEVLHSATLVHDDIVDEADARRGQPSVHTAWSTKVAVLAGDYLFASAADLVARLNRPRIVRQFADTIHMMSRSEFVLPTFDGDPEATRRQYLQKIGGKTAALIALACDATGVLAEAQGDEAQALHDFGWALGMAFQVTDDVLDIAGNSQETGKPVGGDLRAGLLTLPVLEYLVGVAQPTPILGRLAEGEGLSEAESAEAIETLRTTGAVDAARAAAEGFADQAREALARLPSDPAFDALADLVTYATNRHS